MTDDAGLAFAHPEERARASAGADPLDRISLRDHMRSVEIGAFQQERGTLQRINFNVVVEVRPMGDPLDDDVDRILSYDTITEAIDIELGAERLNLLETLAARVADRILLSPLAARVFVRIEKLDRGPFALGVEIVRSQVRAPVRMVDTEPVVRPRVLFLDEAALVSPKLPDLLDQLERDAAPAILCVGPAAFETAKVEQPMPQRRIDLLEIEQNAWRLAARDPRCVVVDSRTELDWAMKHDRLSVWAPSKMALDIADAPEGADPIALTRWCAGLFEACELVFVGAAPLAAVTDVPERHAPGLDAVTL